MKKFHYTWDHFSEDISILAQTISSKIPSANLACIARGGLVPGTVLSHKLGKKLYIIGYQTRDGNDVVPRWITEEPPVNDDLVVVDDILDSGQTFYELSKFLDSFGYARQDYFMSLFCKQDTTYKPKRFDTVNYTQDWIVFPWEV